jgi:hypothetical protein
MVDRVATVVAMELAAGLSTPLSMGERAAARDRRATEPVGKGVGNPCSTVSPARSSLLAPGWRDIASHLRREPTDFPRFHPDPAPASIRNRAVHSADRLQANAVPESNLA